MLELFKTRSDFEKWLQAMDVTLARFQQRFPEATRERLDFTPESLGVVESWLLSRYKRYDELLAESELPIWDEVGRYIGETFRRVIGGHWNTVLDRPSYVSYRLPELTGFSVKPTPVDTHTLATAALDRRNGKYLRGVLEAVRQHVAKSNSESHAWGNAAPVEDSSVWLVMFSGPLPSMADVAAFLEKRLGGQVCFDDGSALRRPQRFTLRKGMASIGVGLNHGSNVLQEAKEITERFAVGRADRARIAGLDKRFEVAFCADDKTDTLNIACHVEYSLREYLGENAVTFMPEVGQFA